MSGIYDNNNRIRAHSVDGLTFTGLYTPDGAWNVVTTGTGYRGAQHPCGALNVTVNDTAKTRHAPDGSMNVTTTTTNNGALKITLV